MNRIDANVVQDECEGNGSGLNESINLPGRTSSEYLYVHLSMRCTYFPARSNTTLYNLLTVTFDFCQAYCAHERWSTTFAQYVLVEASAVAKRKDPDAVPGAQYFQNILVMLRPLTNGHLLMQPDHRRTFGAS